MRTIMISICGLVLLAGGYVQAAPVYQEDFESGTSGDNLSAYGWVSTFGTVNVNTTANLDNLAIAGGASGWYTKDLGTALPDDALYVLTCDSYRDIDHGANFGLNVGTSPSAIVGITTRWDGWVADFRPLIGGDDTTVLGLNTLMNTRVQIAIYIDGVNDQVWATVSDGVTTLDSGKFSITQNQDQLRYLVYYDDAGGTGFEIDNIVLDVPEPATMGLLLIGGCVGLRKKRRK